MKDPSFSFYPDNWIGGTITFTRSHKGAYMDLLVVQFHTGHMSIETIKDVLGSDFENMWENKLKAKFLIDENGLFFNDRLSCEMLKKKEYTENRLKNLNKDIYHMNSHMDIHMDTPQVGTDIDIDNSINNEVKKINIEFDEFWNLYDKKVGDKKKLEKKWLALSNEQREQIMKYIPKYKEAQPDKIYRKNPETFLNNKSWNDEIIQANEHKNLGTLKIFDYGQVAQFVNNGYKWEDFIKIDIGKNKPVWIALKDFDSSLYKEWKSKS